MKHFFYILTAVLGITYTSQAQFPGGGGFGGGRGGGGHGPGGMGQQQQQGIPDLPRGMDVFRVLL